MAVEYDYVSVVDCTSHVIHVRVALCFFAVCCTALELHWCCSGFITVAINTGAGAESNSQRPQSINLSQLRHRGHFQSIRSVRVD